MCVVALAVLMLQAAQIQLDRAAEDFRQLHQERQDLIRQWDEARDAMKSRDEAIQVATRADTTSMNSKQQQQQHNSAQQDCA